jgi:hypothetical protein
MIDFSLFRHPKGHLVGVHANGQEVGSVTPVRAFPLQTPDCGIALVLPDGTEWLWIERLIDLPEPAQTLIREELSVREWVPVIQAILSVTSYSTPCTWSVETDRGETEFVLRAEEDIRRIGSGTTLLLTDAHGVYYRIADVPSLSVASRKILDRFL